MPLPVNEKELKHLYAGVEQFWLNPLQTPKGNIRAAARFKERRDEMARLALFNPGLPPLNGWHLLSIIASILCLGSLVFYGLSF